MWKNRRFKKSVIMLVLAFFLLQTAACGYFIYPERRGTKAGKVDPAVLAMDGACLLLFLIPGVIAFAVDFSSGAIYLPGSKASNDCGATTVVMADPKSLGNEALEKIIHERTGLDIDIGGAEVKLLDRSAPEKVGTVLGGLRNNGFNG